MKTINVKKLPKPLMNWIRDAAANDCKQSRRQIWRVNELLHGREPLFLKIIDQQSLCLTVQGERYSLSPHKPDVLTSYLN